MNLPELNEGWYWNPIQEGTTGTGAKLAKEYKLSVSRSSGLPNYYSSTVFVSISYDTPEVIKEMFQTTLEGLAAATFINHPHQETWNALDEVLTDYEKSRSPEIDFEIFLDDRPL